MNNSTIEQDIDEALKQLHELNQNISGSRRSDNPSLSGARVHRLQKVLVANRGEIAKRFFLALHEEGIPSVAVVTDPDRGQSWYEFADEVIFIGDHENYASIPHIIAAAQLVKANAIYSGYGFLSESADFVEGIESLKKRKGHDIIFMGPGHETMRMVGNKMKARQIARQHEIPLFESSEAIDGNDLATAVREAGRIGYPVMVKLCSGGGGKGVYAASDESELAAAVASASRIGADLYRDPSFYIEKYVKNPVHIEVQIFNGWAIGIRKCAVQRRNQKIIEESGHAFLDDYVSLSLMAAAEKIAHVSGYGRGGGAGTVEFLIDSDTGRFGFMEMNTRLQVEYAVTDQSLGIDIAKWQILFYDGRKDEIIGLDKLKNRLRENDHSIECRIYAEEPENDYLPSPGTIIEMDLPTFNGIRCDFGFMEGDSILPMYDPMIGKLIAHGSTRNEAIIRLERALQELYINGVKTNINQLLRIVRHPEFLKGVYTNNLLDENPELNFKEPDEDAAAPGDRRYAKHVVFGAFAEHMRLLQQSISEFSVIANLGSIMDAPSASHIPSRYTLEYRGRLFLIEFMQTSIDTFHAFVNGSFNGKIILTSINDRCDDLLIIFGSSSFRVRVNRHTGYLDLRMRDESNKINYFRINVIPEGFTGEKNIRKITSPFQGAFVSFCRELRVGDTVRAGEPLLILSSMKMETTIAAPEGGRITYLIEDGDVSRLQIARTQGGRLIGRSIQENELLVIIETESVTARSDLIKKQRLPDENVFPSTSVLDHLVKDSFQESVVKNLDRHFTILIELIYAAAQGYIYQHHIIETLKKTLKNIPVDIDAGIISDRDIDLLNTIIIHYTNIKKLFSPVVSVEGLSYQEELDLFIAGRHEGLTAATRPFELLLKSLLDSYGIPRWDGKSEMRTMASQYVFILFKRAYQFCLDQTDIIKKIVHIISGIRRPGKNIFTTLTRLMEQEQAERDDSLLKFIRKILSSQIHEAGSTEFKDLGADRSPALRNLYVNFRDRFKEDIAVLCSTSLASPAAELIPPAESMPEPVRSHVSARLDRLRENFTVKRLFSPSPSVHLYLLESNDASVRSYIAYSLADFGTQSENASLFGSVFSEAASLIQVYHQIIKGDTCWIEILVRGRTLSWSAGNSNGVIPYGELKTLCASLLNFIKKDVPFRGVICMDMELPFSKKPRSRNILFYRKNDSMVMDLLLPLDRNNPYHIRDCVNVSDQRLIDLGKWPLEIWVEECFEAGSIREILIPSIDEANNGSGGPQQLADRPVGSKIFTGTINGSPACFYMKDSRVSGGSTGSREGLKYIAAAYLSYMNDWPLYVWNDSAGANIMEGLVSLNRGAEGFMMNTLLTERSDGATFRNYVEHTADERLVALFRELNGLFGLSYRALDRRHRSFQLTAVGIGSSAGLDVYGSSQASIQILLDSEESYRVLTGSKVVQTVIGEEITNYDIGGAKILGTWTGIVDIVACDKIHLLSCISMIQAIFCTQHTSAGIERKPDLPAADDKTDRPIVFGESTVRCNVDNGMFWPFKENYYAAESLIGGFAQIGGRRVLIMGPRTHFGLRTLACLIKGRELLKIAYRTGSHQILIFGRNWEQTPDSHENVQMRPRMDFMNTLQKKSGLKIHMVTAPEGLKCFDVNSAADAIIYIRSKTESAAELVFAEKNSTFMVESFAKAFDLAHRLLALIDPLEVPARFKVPGGVPAIPADASEPYDIVESVISHTFDEGSFLEFYRDMNNPLTGPSLITGLAGLEGRTVGVIADQPLLKGGGADALGTEKFRIFIEFLNHSRIPLVMLSNSSGFVPGSQQERHRIQAIGAESLDVNIMGTIPVVSVVLNQNYGGRLIHAFNKFLRPGIVYLALEKAIMAVIGVDAAFDLLFGKKYARLMDKGETARAEELRKSFTESYLEKARASRDGIDSNLVDWTIPSAEDLREHLIKGMKLAYQRCNKAFGASWPE
jgi:acetyl/propionyl-CoA carboxylase alpha subunit/acetyl-CoA carboxylase carboxyltransferase component